MGCTRSPAPPHRSVQVLPLETQRFRHDAIESTNSRDTVMMRNLDLRSLTLLLCKPAYQSRKRHEMRKKINRRPYDDAYDRLSISVFCSVAIQRLDHEHSIDVDIWRLLAGHHRRAPLTPTLSPKGARAISYPCGTANRKAAAGQKGQAVALAPLGERGPNPGPTQFRSAKPRWCSARSLDI